MTAFKPSRLHRIRSEFYAPDINADRFKAILLHIKRNGLPGTLLYIPGFYYRRFHKSCHDLTLSMYVIF